MFVIYMYNSIAQLVRILIIIWYVIHDFKILIIFFFTIFPFNKFKNAFCG